MAFLLVELRFVIFSELPSCASPAHSAGGRHHTSGIDRTSRFRRSLAASWRIFFASLFPLSRSKNSLTSAFPHIKEGHLPIVEHFSEFLSECWPRTWNTHLSCLVQDVINRPFPGGENAFLLHSLDPVHQSVTGGISSYRRSSS